MAVLAPARLPQTNRKKKNATMSPAKCRIFIAVKFERRFDVIKLFLSLLTFRFSVGFSSFAVLCDFLPLLIYNKSFELCRSALNIKLLEVFALYFESFDLEVTEICFHLSRW